MKVEGNQSKGVDIYSLLSKAQSEYSKVSHFFVNEMLSPVMVSKRLTAYLILLRFQTRMNKEALGEPKQIITLPNSGAMTAMDLIKPKAVRVGGAPDVTRTSPSSLEQARSQEDAGKNRLEALFASATKAQQVWFIFTLQVF